MQSTTAGWTYDAALWLSDKILLRGKLGAARRRVLDLAEIRAGESVLDVGCGTGTLALLARERVGSDGWVVGVDPSPRQLARARRKTRGRGVEIEPGVIEKLPFDDATFDAVLCTLTMHDLSDATRRRGLAEIARVLRPGGRVVVAGYKRDDLMPILMAQAGLVGIADGDLQVPRVRTSYVVGRRARQ